MDPFITRLQDEGCISFYFLPNCRENLGFCFQINVVKNKDMVSVINISVKI